MQSNIEKINKELSKHKIQLIDIIKERNNLKKNNDDLNEKLIEEKNKLIEDDIKINNLNEELTANK